jgi:hypothetical protein
MLRQVAARPTKGTLAKSANPIGRAMWYAFYDWTREMSTVKRIAAWSGIFLQGGAIWAATVRSLRGPSEAYTPMERYATAAFILLHRATGEVTYVNAGHNPPIIAGSASLQLEATGVPLGLFPNATYEARTAALPPGGTLLAYTDGLTDAIGGEAPERQVREAILGTPGETLERLTKLIQPSLATDDVTLVVVRRAG